MRRTRNRQEAHQNAPGTPMMFLELSKDWEELANQLEDAFAKLSENEVIGSNLKGSLNENKRLSDLPIWKK